jgi:putative nucleotidyltransferase with HDIG domain
MNGQPSQPATREELLCMHALEQAGRLTGSLAGYLMIVEPTLNLSAETCFVLNGFKARRSANAAPASGWQEANQQRSTKSALFSTHKIIQPVQQTGKILMVFGLSGKLWGYGAKEAGHVMEIGLDLWSELGKASYVEQLEEACEAAMRGWAQTIEERERGAFHHHFDLAADWAVELARHLGLHGPDLGYLKRGAILHDIGKMYIPENILCKPGSLSSQEWEMVRRHPLTGAEIINPVQLLRPAIDVVVGHHERWDGSGYPHGLSKDQIPLNARIFAVVDVFDALICDLPYRPAWPRDMALSYIRQQSGRQFDPTVVEVFLSSESCYKSI